MFEQSILQNGKSRRPWTIALALLLETAVIAVLLVIPLLYVQALPMHELTATLLAPPPPPPPPPPPAPPAVKIHKVTPRKFNPAALTAPRTIPKQQVLQAEIAPPPSLAEAPQLGAVPGGIPGGTPAGVVSGILNSIPAVAPPPPPTPAPAPPAAPAPSRIHVGGNVQAARIEKQVQPEYPKLARQARIGGTVRLKAVIAKDGRIEDLKLITGQPLLVPAAIDAVKQWVYKPTYLNGNPVEVDTEIDVHFTLST